MKKLFLSILLCVGFLLAGASVAFAEVSIIYKGDVLNTNKQILNENGHNIFPVEEFFAAIGCEVERDNILNRITVRLPEKTIVIKPKDGKVWVNGLEVFLNPTPKMINNSIYLPFSFLSDYLGYIVDYKESSIGQFVYLYETNNINENGLENVSKIPRKTPNANFSGVDPSSRTEDYYRWINNNKLYVLTSENDLVEIISLGENIQVRNIDRTTGLFSVEEKQARNKFTYLDKVEKLNQEYLIIMNGKSSENKYIGVGIPANNREIRRITTLTGDYRLYSGIEEFEAIYLDQKTGKIVGSGRENRRGYVLDIQDSVYADKNGDWAKTDDGSYAFAINDQVIILDKELKVRFEERFNKSVTENAVISVNNQYIVLQVVKENNKNNRLYSIVLDNWGNVLRPYELLKVFDESETLRIENCVLDGTNAIILLKTSNGRYLASFNSNIFETSLFQVTANGLINDLIPSPSSYYLFGYDDLYFYLNPVNNY